MTDTSMTKKAVGIGTVTGLGATYMDLCQHVTPILAGYLNAHFPWLGEPVAFEIVCLLESLIPVVAVKATPQFIADSVKDAILWARITLKSWANALWGTLPPQPPPKE